MSEREQGTSAPPPQDNRPSGPGPRRSTPDPVGPKPDALRFGRFERRVLAAMTAVAFVPLLAALLLGRSALREAYGVGMNQRVLHELEQSLDLYHEHFSTLRESAERTAILIAHDARLARALSADPPESVDAVLAADLEALSDVAAIEVAREDGSVVASANRTIDEEAFRTLRLTQSLDAEGTHWLIAVTVSTPSEPFRRYSRAGETVDVYRRLEAEASYFSSFYLFAYIALLLAVIVVALAVGIVVARRVTRRVLVLAEATRKVGKGDLTIEIPTDETDEVGELTDSFNTMVRDIRSSRDRIEYLQRIGAWQEVARRLAHEIKNPLTPIQLAVQEVHRKYDGNDPRFLKTLDDAKGIVEEEVETLRRLVSEFSDFARLPVPDVSPGELGTLVTEWTRTMDPTAMLLPSQEGKDVSLDTRTSGELPVMLDAMMLRRCLDNLVRNAVQAVAEHGENGHVIVDAHRDDDDAILEVRDDGPGVPEKARERVFDPYYTTKSEGTGLGLAIVKKIVLEHGGSVSCGVAPEGGAAFRIRLPIRGARRITQ